MVAGMERVFTHAEATALIPRLTDLLTALRTAQLAAVEQAGEHGRHTTSTNGSAAAAVTGMSVEGAASLAERFRTMLTGDGAAGDDIGDLEALRGVRAYPVRVKCATLVWNALLEGLTETATPPGARIER